MEANLLNKLVEKRIVVPGTELEIKYLAPGLDNLYRQQVTDLFTVDQIYCLKGTTTVGYMVCLRTLDKAKVKATAENILRIDGMLPEDLAKAFDIKADGSMKKVKLDEFGNPIRRGRKPKALLQKIAEEKQKRLVV